MAQLGKTPGAKFRDIAEQRLIDIIVESNGLSAQEMWDRLHEGCVENARKLLGVSKNRHHIRKETWWWTTEAKEAIKAKKLALQAWTKCRRDNID